jgi:hypothetical protein
VNLGDHVRGASTTVMSFTRPSARCPTGIGGGEKPGAEFAEKTC